MTISEPGLDPYLNDPLRWGASMAQHSELMLRCFDAAGARSVIEVGAYAGDLTRVLMHWAAQGDRTVSAVDPSPQPQLVELAEQNEGLELIRQTSLDALPEVALTDVIILDGDHNYYTVQEELRIIGERAKGADLPLVLFHDVCWPHGRRDDYFDPQQIPAEYRHPIAGERMGIFPGDAGTRREGLPYPKSAAHEGGPRNGVLTAAEDFAATDGDLRLVVVPQFFGFGALWNTQSSWAAEMATVLDPWDRNPVLERLEFNRVLHIAGEHALRVQLWDQQEKLGRQESLLRRMLDSSAFMVAERLSQLRVRAGVATGQSVISRAEIRKTLGG